MKKLNEKELVEVKGGFAAIGIGASLFINNSHQLIESNATTISNAIINTK
ncbi:hypothetical protein [Lactobacillus crispatus]